MVRYEDECVGCPPGLGCFGLSCQYKNVPHYYCDKCGEEIYDEVYEDDGYEHICLDCLLKNHQIII